MPIYEYRYTTESGEQHTVERIFRMDEAPQTVTVRVGDEEYEAHRIISRTAKMATNWAKGRDDADLPPVDYIPPGDRRVE